MKKLLVAAVAATAAWMVWTKVQERREDEDIWAEVTADFDETPEEELPYN